ncbi:insulin-like receptor, partial [Ceratina calcarata]|uniref:Insulin-like receptor n=1 Tax=Ceratina calcarata TaxID=156304 RepID=A0AAJ7NA15_9HYME
MRIAQLLLIAFLCAAESLASCQDDGIWFRTNPTDDNEHAFKTADYVDRNVQEATAHGRFERDLDGLVEPLYGQHVPYRGSRAIDVSRSTEANTKLTQQPGTQSNLPKPSTKPSTTYRPIRRKNVTIGDGICQSIDIRNSAAAFEIMKDCQVIEGFLQIVLIENNSEKDFKQISYPKLREITGYFLLYRVNGLKTLSNLFPNLEVIRGNILLTDYAFMVYEMQNLQEIGLKKLTEISRGSVRIEKNPTLCYTNTVEWNKIVSAGENVIKDNGQEASCP